MNNAAETLNPMQGVLLPPSPIATRLTAAGGVVRLEDLEWPVFDPEAPKTMAQYIGEIGIRMSETPRESITVDSVLGLYGQDFQQAEPNNLLLGLYYPRTDKRERPQKTVVKVSWGDLDLDRSVFRGVVDRSTGVAVSEHLYQEIVKNPPFYANQIDNGTQNANSDNPIVESVADVGGESAVYGLTEKHQILEARDQDLLEERAKLYAVYNNIAVTGAERRVRQLEPYRLGALVNIQEMVRVACKSLGYGTNATRNTQNAVASNIHRSPDGPDWLKRYTGMAINYNDAVRGKVNQSILGIIDEIGFHRDHLINNLDREYTDPKPRASKSKARAA